MWRSGLAGRIAVAVVAGIFVMGSMVPAVGRVADAAAPSNDDLASALLVADAPFVDGRDTGEATQEPGERVSGCSLVGNERGVWYRIRLAYDAVLVLDTGESRDRTDSGLDTVLSVWRYAADHPLVELACNDDASVMASTSRIVLEVESERDYLVKVGTNDQDGGRTAFRVTAASARPANDDLASASRISALPYTDTQDLQASTPEADEVVSVCQYGWPDESGVWYELDFADAPGAVIDTAGSLDAAGKELDTVLSAWTGGPGHPLTELACNDDAGSRVSSRMVLSAPPEGRLWVKGSGLAGSLGTLRLHVSALPARPPNDDLSAAVLLGDEPASVSFDSTAATEEVAEARASCGVDGLPGRSVWFIARPPAAARLVIGVAAAEFQPIVSLWRGGRHPLSEVACGFEEVGPGIVGLVADVPSDNGTLVRISGVDGQGGSGALLVLQAAPRPTNDDLAAAIDITAMPYIDRRDATDATDEPGEMRSACTGTSGPERGLWYRYRSAEATELLVEASPRGPLDVPATISIWADAAGHPLFELDCATSPAAARVTVSAGEAVRIRVNPADERFRGAVRVSVSRAPARPANDDLDQAVDVASLPFTHRADTRSASSEPNELVASCSAPGYREASVWYRFAPALVGAQPRIAADAAGSDYPAVISVWRGDAGHPLEEVACTTGGTLGARSELAWSAESGMPYYLKVAGMAGASGSLQVTFRRPSRFAFIPIVEP